jgi:hypothetical protein
MFLKASIIKQLFSFIAQKCEYTVDADHRFLGILVMLYFKPLLG